MRPIDIARRLKISTTTLRHYEVFGLIPEVMRSPAGYRIYTDKHIAYFICIREMLHGFTLSEIAKILKPVLMNQIDEALWMANEAQVTLQRDKYVCDQIKKRFLMKKKTITQKEYSIDNVSKITGVNPSTIRYWDNIGLISASRSAVNNYRTFTQRHIDEILMIQALKLSMRAQGEKYAVEQIRIELQKLKLEDTDRISALVAGINNHLATLNRSQIKSICALYQLCNQVEQNHYEISYP
jgi:DNA-binding transcriptional MerR regulator